MKVISIAAFIGTGAATTAPTASPTFFTPPTAPSRTNAISIDYFSDAACTKMNTADVYTTTPQDSGSKTWKANQCLVLLPAAGASPGMSRIIDTDCFNFAKTTPAFPIALAAAACKAGESYDVNTFVGTACAGTAQRVTTNFQCHLVSKVTSGGTDQYEAAEMFDPVLAPPGASTIVGEIFNDAACKVSQSPVYITTRAPQGNCSDIYTLGIPQYESRVSLTDVSQQTVEIELFGKHTPTNTVVDPVRQCVDFKRVTKVVANKGTCTLLEPAAAGFMAATNGCTGVGACYTYIYTDADLHPAAASTSAISVAAVVGALGIAALLA
jgi:hypothetical protein